MPETPTTSTGGKRGWLRRNYKRLILADLAVSTVGGVIVAFLVMFIASLAHAHGVWRVLTAVGLGLASIPALFVGLPIAIGVVTAAVATFVFVVLFFAAFFGYGPLASSSRKSTDDSPTAPPPYQGEGSTDGIGENRPYDR